MKNVRKLLGSFVVFVCTLLFVPNSVYALNIDSPTDLITAFDGMTATINGSTITLTGNVEFNDVIEISGGNYILNLDGHKLSAGEIYVNDGSLVINDSQGTGEIDTEYDFLMIVEGAKLTVNNGKLDYLANEGTATINNATINFIMNYGTVTIENGTFGAIGQMGIGTINGGVFTAYKEDDEFGNHIYSSLDYENTILNGGEFKNTNADHALVIQSSTSIKGDSINDIVSKGYIAAYNGSGENSPDSWVDEETGETIYNYVVNYPYLIVIEDETDAIFNKIAPNNVWTINGSKPKDLDDAEFLLNAMADDLELSDKYKAYAYADSVGDTIDPEKITIYLEYSACNGCYLKSKTVKAVYNEPSNEVKTSVNSVLDKIAEKTGENHDVETDFLLEDLYLINYLNASTKGMNNSLALNFSKELIALTNGGNISYKYDSRLGGSTPTGLWGYSGGRVIVYYDGVAVGTTEIGLTISRVLYVPSDTLDTDEARIAAALKRIEEYLGTTKGITISVGGTLDSLNKDGYTWKDYGFIDAKTSGTNYYNVTINGETHKFAICKKDASKLETPEYLASDIISNISIKSSSTELPLDTAITVKSVTGENIEKALGTDLYAAYDISLYSNAKQVNISKLENGKFIVSIPVPEVLKGKNITVYYVSESGEIEEHVATVKDGIASFETNHFSTYALAEKITPVIPVIPETLDGIVNSVFVLLISSVVIAGTLMYLNNRNKERTN